MAKENLEVPVTENDVDRELARRSLLNFTLYTKPEYEVNWHHKLICEKLDSFAQGEIPRLLIMAPPRHGKSELVSRRLPAFLLGINPDAQVIAASYSADLASRMNRDVQRIIDTPKYLELFPETRLYGKNIRNIAKGAWLRNNDIFEVVDKKGVYRSAGIGGGITGMGASFAIIDDPIKDQAQADSLAYRDGVWEWYGSTLYSRLEKPGSVLLTLTRWHEDDLAGRLLEAAKNDPEADRWEILSLPAISEEDLEIDPRKKGEALWPTKFPVKKLSAMRATVGTRVFTALWQQRPSAAEGTIVKRNWLQFYRELPDHFEEWLISWDLATKDNAANDFSVGQVWGRLGARYYLIAQIRDRMDFPAELIAFQSLSASYPKAFAKLVEDKSNGPALISSLKKEISGIIAFNPKTSKQQRLAAVSPAFEAENVYFPHPSIAPWVHDNIEELVSFPNGKFDDTVDATTQALLRFRGELSGDFTEEYTKSRSTMVGAIKSGDRW